MPDECCKKQQIEIYATKLQRDLHSSHGPTCRVQTYFLYKLDQYDHNDHINYKSVGDSYYCNIGIYA